jgi:hypothetical protein
MCLLTMSKTLFSIRRWWPVEGKGATCGRRQRTGRLRELSSTQSFVLHVPLAARQEKDLQRGTVFTF